MSKLIEQMIKSVQDGYTPRSVYEATLTYHPGSTVRVNKDTTGILFPTGGDVSVPHGTIVSIVGVGAGPSGKDHLVRLPDGQQATIPFYNLGESVLRRFKSRTEDLLPPDKDKKEDDPSRTDDEPGFPPAEDDDTDLMHPEGDDEVEDDDKLPTEAEDPDKPTETDDKDDDPAEGDAEPDVDDDERIVRVELTKPLSPEAEDWLKSGYKEAGMDIPELPEDDQPDSVSFLMKAKDQESLGKGIGDLKKVAGESIQKIEPASKEDWDKN